MKVRILKPFYFKPRNQAMLPGDVVDVPEEDGNTWVKMHMAEITGQSPDLPTGSEKAVISPEETAEKPVLRKPKKKKR